MTVSKASAELKQMSTEQFQAIVRLVSNKFHVRTWLNYEASCPGDNIVMAVSVLDNLPGQGYVPVMVGDLITRGFLWDQELGIHFVKRKIQQ